DDHHRLAGLLRLREPGAEVVVDPVPLDLGVLERGPQLLLVLGSGQKRETGDGGSEREIHSSSSWDHRTLRPPGKYAQKKKRPRRGGIAGASVGCCLQDAGCCFSASVPSPAALCGPPRPWPRPSRGRSSCSLRCRTSTSRGVRPPGRWPEPGRVRRT